MNRTPLERLVYISCDRNVPPRPDIATHRITVNVTCPKAPAKAMHYVIKEVYR